MTPESRAQGFFSLLPPARIRARKALSEIVDGSLQVPFFHGSEINALDIGFRPKLAQNGEKPTFF
jgi:hypothetical protein